MISGDNNLSSSYFLLIGIPGMENIQFWFSLPVFSMYLITLLANISVLLTIKTEESLHQPMYLFLSMLLLSDLVQSNTVLPKMLLIFLFNLQEITFEGCLVQMFFIHSFTVMCSSVLLAMAFDRYVAICQPLRYTTILTNPLITKIGVLAVIRGTLLVLPYPFLVRRLFFCSSHRIEHTYCEHIAVAKLACADIGVNVVYGLVAILLTAVDLIGITVSYSMIVISVFNLPSREARHKVGSTCVSHICVILLAYIPALFAFVTQRFGGHTASSSQIILSNLYLIIPPMLNPIIYGVKTKEIKRNVLKLYCPQKSRFQ
ncbi:putative olfactory receptor 52P1 [Rana temporaria]|uniref:putative olfactory receptor 52P1 n=1 Tax=Rana temporaria TaxID=8407 RepID=UPI001AADEC11|nr:putative olfactory receptor 52P1 [Rana temporaria]